MLGRRAFLQGLLGLTAACPAEAASKKVKVCYNLLVTEVCHFEDRVVIHEEEPDEPAAHDVSADSAWKHYDKLGRDVVAGIHGGNLRQLTLNCPNIRDEPFVFDIPHANDGKPAAFNWKLFAQAMASSDGEEIPDDLMEKNGHAVLGMTWERILSCSAPDAVQADATIYSAYRSKAKNEACGGKPNSLHKKFAAIDWGPINNATPLVVGGSAAVQWLGGLAYYLPRSGKNARAAFCHTDLGRRRTWEPTPVSAMLDAYQTWRRKLPAAPKHEPMVAKAQPTAPEPVKIDPTRRRAEALARDMGGAGDDLMAALHGKEHGVTTYVNGTHAGMGPEQILADIGKGGR